MSQAVAHPVPNVFFLRRKKVPDELSLPADYVPTDYTSLPEPPEEKKSNPLRLILIILVVLVFLGAVGYAVVFLQNDNTSEATPVPPPTFEITQADMIVRNDQLVTRISAKTNAPDGTNVTAELLENGAPFNFWNAADTTAQVSGGNVEFMIPEADSHEAGRKSAEYTVQLVPELANAQPTSSTLTIPTAAEERFFGAVAEATPTAEPTATTAVTTDTATVAPTVEASPAPAATGPLENIAISRAGIAYASPYGPANAVGNVAPGQVTTLVAKLPVGTETWYLIPVPENNVSGWINSNLIDLPPADVNRIPTVSGDNPFAVVFNGGNVRATPVNGQPITQIAAGQNVRVVGRVADNSWFQIETPQGTGWVSAFLLTINPDIIASIPVVQ